MKSTMVRTASLLPLLVCISTAQQPDPIIPAPSQSMLTPELRTLRQPPSSGPQHQLHSDYVLGPDDEIVVRVLEAEEITDKPIRIDMNGCFRLPYVGRFKAAGLTAEQLERELTKGFSRYFRQPDVSVSIAEFRSQPVSVIGAVKNPGVHQLQGRKTLIEVLSLAGGLDAAAGSTVKVTRRLEWGRIPVPTATDDPTGQFSIGEVSVKAILGARNPEENFTVKPYDVISVPRAEMVYVTGEVQRSGGFLLNEHESMTVLQALTLAGGMGRTASPDNARILRASGGEPVRAEIAVNVKKILEGKTRDVPMQPEDILFIPSSVPKRVALRAAEAALQIGTGVVIWRK